jgi:ABC-type nitrate/sulfonate/bicarbonate transport system permease component
MARSAPVSVEPRPARVARPGFPAGVRRGAVGLALPLAVLVAWQLAGTTGLLAERYPTPLRVLGTLAELIASGDAFRAVYVSSKRILGGFAVALVLGILVGVLLATLTPFRKVSAPLIEVFRSIAPVAWIPLAIFWFGSGDQSAMFIVAYAAFFPIVTNVWGGIGQIDRRYFEAAAVLGAPKLMVVRQVILPGALPLTLVGLRLGFGVAWAAIIAAEMTVGARAGAGNIGGLGQEMYLIFLYGAALDPIVAWIVVVGTIAYLMDVALKRLEHRVAPWIGR